MAQVRVGISGWRYAGWRGDFYPRGLVQRHELSYAAERLSSIEINGSFYALQRPQSYATWRDQTPDDFVFALKAGRYITHMKRLVDVETPIANFFASGPFALAAKLGPVLWQLPAASSFDADILERFLRLLPASTAQAARLARRHDAKVPSDKAMVAPLTHQRIRHAFEPRHPSFADPQVVEMLSRYDVGLVVSDGGDRWPRFERVTSDFVYVRLHGAEELYASGYTDAALETWAQKITTWTGRGLDVYVYFDNDAKVHAPYDALRLMERLGVSRTSTGTATPT